MSLPHREQLHLRRIGRSLGAADPHLAAMLVIFARLAAGEAMPAGEGIPRRLPPPVRALARAAIVIARLAARLLLACGRAGRRVALGILAVGAIVCRRLRGRTGRPYPSAMGRETNN